MKLSFADFAPSHSSSNQSVVATSPIAISSADIHPLHLTSLKTANEMSRVRGYSRRKGGQDQLSRSIIMKDALSDGATG